MNLSRRKARWLLFGLAAIILVQLGSSAFYRYLRCKSKAEELFIGEALCRQKANVCEELAIRLREVGVMAREMAQSATSDFERSKWLKMADLEEQKATRANKESAELMLRAEYRGNRADAFYEAAWRPWRPEPD